MQKKIYTLTAVVGFLVVTAVSGLAQSRHVTASNLGLGGGGTAYLDSYHANFVNPANLMLNEDTKPRFSIGLIGGLSTTAGGTLFNTTVYNDYFTKGLTVSGDVAEEALDKWFGSDPQAMKNAGAELDVVPLGTSYRAKNWALSAALRTRVLFNTRMNRVLMELGIHGLNGEVFGEPRPVNFNAETMTVGELSAGFAVKLLNIPSLFGLFRNVKLYAGAAPKMLLGSHFSQLDFRSNLQIVNATDEYVEEIRHDFEYTFETTGSVSEQLTEFYNDRQASSETPNIGDYVDPEGSDFYDIKASGFGLDLGATVEMEFDLPVVGILFKGPERLRVGASLTDLGTITFDNQAGRFTADDMLVWEGFKIDRERIDEEFNGDEEEYYRHVLVDSIATEIYGSFEPDGSRKITRGLPSMLNFGAQLTLNKLSVSLDLGKGFVERGVNSKRVSLATGIEYRLFGFMPFRVGMHTGGLTSTSYSAGWGIEFRNFEFSVAAASVRRSLNHGANASAAWSGLVFRF